MADVVGLALLAAAMAGAALDVSSSWPGLCLIAGFVVFVGGRTLQRRSAGRRR